MRCRLRGLTLDFVDHRLRHAEHDATDEEEHHDRNDARCLLATRLLSAYDAQRHAMPLEEAMADKIEQMAQLESTLATLDELRHWTDSFVEMQMMWVDCGARVDAAAALRVWNRMDTIIRDVAQQRDSAQQLALFRADLPALVAKATTVVTQQHHDRTVGRYPATLSLDHHHTSVTDALGDSVGVRARVELPHQWVPRVLHAICESVERAFAAGRCRPALVDATRRIREVIRDRNPYAYLSVLYRSPPPSTRRDDPNDAMDGRTQSNDWTLYGSRQTAAIARLLRDPFNELLDFADWMQKPDTSFWKTFARFLRCVRRVAIAFHHVMIHLYATAMQRQHASVTAEHVAQEIEAALATHAAFTLQSDGYGLAAWFQTASDAIFHETYVMFPEVLVYVDQWRHEFSVYEHGFAPTERARDYEVGFHKWKSSKTWLEMAYQAKTAAYAWHRSRLGSRRFQSMTFPQLGRLEKEIKQRLGKITDLLYKQNLAKWSQQRYQHGRARALVELEIMDPGRGCMPVVGSSHAADAEKRVQSSNEDEVHVTNKQKRFRPPTLSRTLTVVKIASAQLPTELENEDIVPIDEEAILRWSDDEIDAHEQETERLYELQGGMLSESDALSLPRLFVPEAEDFLGDTLDEPAAVRGLYLGCRRLRAMTRKIVARGEEIALHGAADALIQRPSLRTLRPTDQGHESVISPTKSLETAVTNSALRFLNLHQAAATYPDTQDTAQKLALEALDLLRRAQAQCA